MAVEERRCVVDDEVDLRELFLSLWRRRWVIAGLTVAAGLLAAAVSLSVVPPVYESRTYIQLSEHSSPAYATPQAAARVLSSMSFLRPIAARHGIPDGRRLERMVRADPVRDTRMVYLRIRDRDPDRLRAFTRDVVREFLQAASQRVVERRRLAQERYHAITTQVKLLEPLARQASRAGGSGGSEQNISAAWLRGTYGELLRAQREVEDDLASIELPYLVQEPYVPPEPVSPRPGLNAAVAATLGFLVAVFGVLVRDAWAAGPKPAVQLAGEAGEGR